MTTINDTYINALLADATYVRLLSTDGVTLLSGSALNASLSH